MTINLPILITFINNTPLGYNENVREIMYKK